MASKASIINILTQAPHTRILCVGDLMLDRYVEGTVSRISPEAPVPVLHVRSERNTLGGACNVAINIAKLGATCILIGGVGCDKRAKMIKDICNDVAQIKTDFLEMPDYNTILKVRYTADQQQLLRTDYETKVSLTRDDEQFLLKKVEHHLKDCDLVVLSDYGKGLLDEGRAQQIIKLAHKYGKRVVVDPKGQHYEKYAGADLVTPNRKELKKATGLEVQSDGEVTHAAQVLIKKSGLKNVLVTRSQAGMTLVTDGRKSTSVHIPTEAQRVFDVAGAGDTVVATLGVALACGVNFVDAAGLANRAAGIVVSKRGTAWVEPQELLETSRYRQGRDKRLSLQEGLKKVKKWQEEGKVIGFTNGCFDILHPGHIALLSEARSNCDRLIVGLNTDTCVSKLKGPNRPIQNEHARARVLSALGSVDMVILFCEETPYKLIEALEPDVLIKGSDYTVETVVGADIVQAKGGRIVLVDLIEGQSTTSIETKIAQS